MKRKKKERKKRNRILHIHVMNEIGRVGYLHFAVYYIQDQVRLTN